MRISTWNIKTMLTPGKIEEIVTELKKIRITIAAVQETRWKRHGSIDSKYYII